MIVTSAFPVLLMLPVLMIILISFVFNMQRGIPQPQYRQLSYHRDRWILHLTNGSEIPFDKVLIEFNVTLFFLLRLSGRKHETLLVIFNDQITRAQYRLLKFIAFRSTSTKTKTKTTQK